MEKITILNTSIITAPGGYVMTQISLNDAREWVRKCEFCSAVGHQATAEILTKLLQVEINVNRIEFTQKPQSLALVFKLRGRPEEGKILTKEEVEKIGYDFYLLNRYA